MTPPPPDSAPDADFHRGADQVERGRRIIIGCLLAMTAFSIIVSIGWNWKYGITLHKLQQQMTCVALLWLIGMMLLQGRAWARWLTVALILIGVMIMAPVFFAAESWNRDRMPGTLAALGIYVFYVVIGRLLIYSPAVNAFFREHRRRRETIKARWASTQG